MIVAAAVAAVAVACAALIPVPPAAPVTRSGTDIWVATNGSDGTCRRSKQALPCLSLDRARDIARCGDDVDIRSGTYGAQTVSGAPNDCSSHPVLFSVVRGTATFGTITLNTSGVRLTGITTNARVSLESGCNGCQLYDSTFPAFDTSGADNTEIVDNDIGPSTPTCTYGQNSLSPGKGANPSDGFLIAGNTFHDFQCDSPHSEALYIAAYSRRGLIENNTFRNNGNTSHIFFTWCDATNDDCASWGGGYKDPTDWCVRQNTYFDTWTAFFAINGRDELAGNPNLNIHVQRQKVRRPVIPPGAGGGSNLAGFMFPLTRFMLASDCTDPR